MEASKILLCSSKSPLAGERIYPVIYKKFGARAIREVIPPPILPLGPGKSQEWSARGSVKECPIPT